MFWKTGVMKKAFSGSVSKAIMLLVMMSCFGVPHLCCRSLQCSGEGGEPLVVLRSLPVRLTQQHTCRLCKLLQAPPSFSLPHKLSS